MNRLPLLAAAMLLITASCTDTSNRPMPRRTAFPRVNLYDTIYTAVRVGNVHLAVNAQATTTFPRQQWIDVAYPRYGATLHLSVVNISTDEMSDAIDNRMQRIALNLGDATAEQFDFSSENFSCRLIVAPEAGQTPVQLLATNNSTIISGTAVFSGNTTPIDSIRPIVDAIAKDALYLLQNLSMHDALNTRTATH